MKNYTQKWKELNKNGIKLSLICGLNWLIKFLFKGQFYLFSAVFFRIADLLHAARYPIIYSKSFRINSHA